MLKLDLAAGARKIQTWQEHMVDGFWLPLLTQRMFQPIKHLESLLCKLYQPDEVVIECPKSQNKKAD